MDDNDLHLDIRKKTTSCIITCAEPGCTNRIHYDTTDLKIPLYCTHHRTKHGRHSQTRQLNYKNRSRIS